MVTLVKFAGLVLSSVVIQLDAGECTPSVDRALIQQRWSWGSGRIPLQIFLGKFEKNLGKI